MQPSSSTQRPELLALRALKLGDLLVAVPAIHALRRANPDHRLVLAVPQWLAPIVALIGGVDALLPTPGLDRPLRKEPGSVDIAVNLHGNGPESRGLLAALEPHRLIAHAAPGYEGPPWLDGILERRRWALLVSAHGMPANEDDVGLLEPARPPAVDGCSTAHSAIVHVGAFYGSRSWPAERFAEVAAGLAADGRHVLISGGPTERVRALRVAARAGLPESRVLAGRLGLGDFAAVVAAADLLVSVDTGAAHLASAYGIPSVVLFGPAPPEEWGPPRTGPHLVLTDATRRRGDTFADTPDPALLAVSSADVLAAARTRGGVPVVRPLTRAPRVKPESARRP